MKEKLKGAFHHKYGEIAEYIYYYDKGYSNLSTKDIVQKYHISASTLTKFIKYIGYESFQEMKYSLMFQEKVYLKGSENILYDVLFTNEQLSTFNSIISDIKDCNDLIILSCIEYINHTNELINNINQKYNRDIKIVTPTEFENMTLSDSKKILSFGNIGEKYIRPLLENKIKTTIIGYNNELISTPRVSNFHYLTFDESLGICKFEIVLLITLLVLSLDTDD